MKVSQYILIILILVVSGFQGFSSGITSTVTVEHYRTPFPVWDGPYMSYNMNLSSGESINLIWGIKGFDSLYKWGTQYTLKVKKKTLRNPPVDTPGFEYSLVEVLSSESVGPDVRFKIPLKKHYDLYLEKSDDSATYSLLHEIEVRFISPGLEAEFISAIPVSSSITGEFTHDPGGGLILRNFSNEFNLEMAIDYILDNYEDREFSDISDWKETEFITFIKSQ